LEKIVELVIELSRLRNIPQFIFYDGIHMGSMFKVRNEVIKFKSEFPDCIEIDFIINSGGGSPADAYRIIRTLRTNFKTVNIIIPFWAKSAATLLSLGGNSIIMDEFGEFGPLDIQIGIEREDSPEIERESALNDEYSVRRIEARAQEVFYQMFTHLHSSDDVKINKNELSKQLFEYQARFYEPLLKQINPYNLGRKKRMLDIGEQYAKRILNIYNEEIDENRSNFLIDYLVNKCPDHGFVIDYNIIARILNNVIPSKNISKEYEEKLQEIVTETILLQGNSNHIQIINIANKHDNQNVENTSNKFKEVSLKDINNGITSNDKKNGINKSTSKRKIDSSLSN
jgi:hypothetical protein